MDAYYAAKMAKKTEAELLEYFLNHHKYVAEAVLAAVKELQNRGRAFTEAELATVEPERRAVEQAAVAATSEETSLVDEEVELPRLYSPGAIFGFSIFFSLIFGAALLATNIRTTGNRRGSWIVVGFSVAYMFLEALVVWQLNRSSSMSLAFNLAGAFILNYYFWPKYIGTQLDYEAKPIWRALIISVLIVLPVLVIMMLFGPQK
jgi:hypothetical protein